MIQFNKGDCVTIKIFADEGSDFDDLDYYFSDRVRYTTFNKDMVEIVKVESQHFTGGYYVGAHRLYHFDELNNIWCEVNLADVNDTTEVPIALVPLDTIERLEA